MKTLFGLFFSLVFTGAWAQSPVAVQDPWVRATVAQQKATGAFMRLTAAMPLRLVQVQSPVAGVAEIHEMVMDQDVMRMRATPGVDLPAAKAVELKPGGYHIMLLDLKQPVKPGDSVALTLVLESPDGQRQRLQVQAVARPLGAMNSMH